MRLVYRFNIGKDEEISKLCKVSNNLYNQALYVFRETLKNESKWLSYFELDKILKNTKNLDGKINYRLLKAQCSQQVLKLLDNNIKSYYRSIQDYKKHPNKYKEKPGLPKYRKRGSEFNLYYPNQSCIIRNGKIILSKKLFVDIPQYEKYSGLLENFKQVRILPNYAGYRIEVIYEVEDIEIPKSKEEKIASIDLGIDNLATLVSEDFTYLFSGKFVKSYNKLFNKTLAKLNSIKDLQKIKGITKRINKLYYDREQYIEDVFHKISRKIINLLTNSGITKLIVGYNKGWKQGVNIGKRNNQKFTQIPFARLISYLEYKCELAGIEIVTHEESYTSKCDSLAFEAIGKHENYLGKRKKRGLYQSSTGKLINADVNGALNIMRKVVDDSSNYVQRIIDRGLLFNPVRIKSVF
jgi:IS605 OrfB family transposase